MSFASITTVTGVTVPATTTTGSGSVTLFWLHPQLPIAANSAPASSPGATSLSPVTLSASASVAYVLLSLVTVNTPRTKPGTGVPPLLPGAQRARDMVS